LSRDAAEWTAADVRLFLETILPGHPCVDCFKYTSGYVLCSLDKEDIRRQAHSEEAANAIWSELQGCRKLPAVVSPSWRPRPPQERGLPEAVAAATEEGAPPSTVLRRIVYVRVPKGETLEFEVAPADTIASLKAQFAARAGLAPEGLRLVTGGLNMQDERTIASYKLHQGAVLLLVPHLKDPGILVMALPAKFAAPRGLMMVPGGEKWQPSQPSRPFLPVVGSDVSHKFPVSLEFESAPDCEAFMNAAVEEPPLLEIQPATPGGAVMETRVQLDFETGGVSFASGSYSLSSDTRYEAFAHFGGPGGNVKVVVETGAVAA
jgi:hypothetical protein